MEADPIVYTYCDRKTLIPITCSFSWNIRIQTCLETTAIGCRQGRRLRFYTRGKDSILPPMFLEKLFKT